MLFDVNSSPKRVLFRVDCGRVRGLSYGHIFRCMVLSRVFKEVYNSESLFLLRNNSDGIRFALDNNLECVVINDGVDIEDEGNAIIENVLFHQCDVMISDLPYPNANIKYYAELKRRGVRVIHLDDCGFIRTDADVLINSSILATKMFKHHANTNTRMLLGSRVF